MIRLLYNVRDKLNEITIKSHIAANFLTLDLEKEQELTASLKTNYLANLSSDPDYVDSDVGQQDLKDHLFGRLWDDRRTVVPWLDSLRPLRGASILEVGCGPGASTVALAEQGALVIGVEIDANNLTVANDRCRLYGLQNPPFHVMNGAEIDCLELERFRLYHLLRLSRAYDTAGAVLCTSARMVQIEAGWLSDCHRDAQSLWWYDAHTSLLPFFNWLPDNLAIEYSTRSGRRYFNRLYHPPIDEQVRLDFSRWGRGASYHEFELSIPELRQVEIACMNIWIRRRNPVQLAKHIVSGDRRFARMLTRIGGREIHPAFYESFLNLAIRKQG